MKITTKLLLILVPTMFVCLSTYSIFSIQRQVEIFEDDIKRDASIAGHAIAQLIEDIRQDSRDDARFRAILADIQYNEPDLDLRWVWLEKDAPDQYKSKIPLSDLGGIKNGEDIVIRRELPSGKDALFIYVPVKLNDNYTAAIEVTETLSAVKAYTRNSIFEIIVLVVAMTVAMFLIAMLAGTYLIEKPIARVIDKTKQIGAGNLADKIEYNRNDEIKRLCDEINTMQSQIFKAKEELKIETTAKVKAIEQMRHVDRLSTVGQLASGIAHELGTPLNVITERAKMIVRETGTVEEAKRSASAIQEQSENITKIVQDLLNFARRRGPQKAPNDIDSLFRSVIGLLRPILKKKDINIEINKMTNDMKVNLDAMQMQQVFMNLIVNSMEAMNSKGKIEINIATVREAKPEDGLVYEVVRIDVADEGKGIGVAKIEKVFDPFYTTKEVGKGTGLGLSVARGIVEDHDGWISVASSVNRGSIFSVFLPTGGAI